MQVQQEVVLATLPRCLVILAFARGGSITGRLEQPLPQRLFDSVDASWRRPLRSIPSHSFRNALMSIRTEAGRFCKQSSMISLVAASLAVSTSCSSRERVPNDSSAAHVAAANGTAGAASDEGSVSVRGTIASASDTGLSVTTATGVQQVHIVGPLRVYARTPSDLAHVTPNSFVGITSVTQPDGSQQATEIHIFPEELRGTGEGSRLMAQSAGGGRNTMTNGAVSPSRMTNGSVGASRMTNGAVGSTAGGTTVTVRYQGGEQTIKIPPGVTVTAITPAPAKLAVGANVVVLARKDVAGQLSTSAVMLTGPTPTK